MRILLEFLYVSYHVEKSRELVLNIKKYIVHITVQHYVVTPGGGFLTEVRSPSLSPPASSANLTSPLLSSLNPLTLAIYLPFWVRANASI